MLMRVGAIRATTIRVQGRIEVMVVLLSLAAHGPPHTRKILTIKPKFFQKFVVNCEILQAGVRRLREVEGGMELPGQRATHKGQSLLMKAGR